MSQGLADCRFVHLRGSIELIRSRLAERKHRYMPASLLESQFATLEPPQDAIEVDVSQAPTPACGRSNRGSAADHERSHAGQLPTCSL